MLVQIDFILCHRCWFFFSVTKPQFQFDGIQCCSFTTFSWLLMLVGFNRVYHGFFFFFFILNVVYFLNCHNIHTRKLQKYWSKWHIVCMSLCQQQPTNVITYLNSKVTKCYWCRKRNIINWHKIYCFDWLFVVLCCFFFAYALCSIDLASSLRWSVYFFSVVFLHCAWCWCFILHHSRNEWLFFCC